MHGLINVNMKVALKFVHYFNEVSHLTFRISMGYIPSHTTTMVEFFPYCEYEIFLINYI